ncbi:hypothetical protein [Streptomyces sp. NPDC002619]|uniref:hypothetical protein n=1 Tax=Streptomyces sp. NPDC002619 TaxID=3364655 RepID=UPI0036C86606
MTPKDVSSGRTLREHPEPKLSTVKELYASAMTCGSPQCGQPLYRQSTTAEKRILNSRVAHIHARSEGGARWDPAMSSEENRAFGNLILLCEAHHSEVDGVPEFFPAELLRSWKQKQVQEHDRALGFVLTDAEVAEVSATSFDAEGLLERVAAVVPFSARSRSRLEALELAARSSRARSLVRLRSTADDRRAEVMAWRFGQSASIVEVPEGCLRVLVAPMGAGKSEEAERWWSEGVTRAWADSEIAIPVWLEARLVQHGLASAVQDSLGGDPNRECRIVIDDLDSVSPSQADELMNEARRLVLVWPRVSVLATTRPGAGDVEETERIDVAPWPLERGLGLLRVIVGEDAFWKVDAHETRQLLTSPLLVHALGSRLRAGGNSQASPRELLSGLADSILRYERPASRGVWSSLVRLAASVMDSAGLVKASSFGREHEIWELEETGLVVRADDRLRFALPLFEQHFAAQALQDQTARLEDAAGPERFPRWRYAIAFAVDTAAADVAEELMLRLARTNPAAASWVLDEIVGTTPRADLDAAKNMDRGIHGSGEEPALTAGQWLRSAMLAWLAGVGDLGSQLARQHEGKLAPWGVRLEEDFMLLAEAREGVLNADLVVRQDLQFGGGLLSQFHSVDGFSLPQGRLGRWVWARNRLRKKLSTCMERRVLPVPPLSPLATERLWFLARRVLADSRRQGSAPIPVQDLRVKVDAMMEQVENSAWCTWRVAGDTIDSADVRWLHTELQHIHQSVLAAPRPPGDRRNGAQFVWQAYSPELTRSITTDVLRDALAGYRHLVETNFPRFGHALGLYSIMPVRLEGLVIMPAPSDSTAWTATVEYTLRTDTLVPPSAESIVNLELVEEPDVPTRQWMDLPGDSAAVFRVPGVQQEPLVTHHERQATNLAYTWLARDLHAVGWLENRSPYFG